LESSQGTRRSLSHRAGDLMIKVCLKLVLLFDFLGSVVLSGDGQDNKEGTEAEVEEFAQVCNVQGCSQPRMMNHI